MVSAPSPSGAVTVVVGSSLESVHEASRRLRGLLLVGVPAAVLLLGPVVWLLIGGALGRIDRIRAAVDAIGADELGRRVDEHGPYDEVGRLAATMNRMLSRVDTAVMRQRRLVADVSHDLQGPLAAQRLALEVALRDPAAVDPVELREGVLGPTRMMERLVDDLLVLAAADEQAPVVTSSIDLDTVVLDEAARARSHTGVRIDTTHVSAGPVRANPSEVRRAVRNLLDNAVTYADSEVELSVATTSDAVVLDVVDDGPGIGQTSASSSSSASTAATGRGPVGARQRPRTRHRAHGRGTRGRPTRPCRRWPRRSSRRTLPDGAARAAARLLAQRGEQRAHRLVLGALVGAGRARSR